MTASGSYKIWCGVTVMFGVGFWGAVDGWNKTSFVSRSHCLFVSLSVSVSPSVSLSHTLSFCCLSLSLFTPLSLSVSLCAYQVAQSKSYKGLTWLQIESAGHMGTWSRGVVVVYLEWW